MTSKEVLEKLYNEFPSECWTIGTQYDVELSAIEKDLEILEKYRKLFETIKKQNLSLEYTGHELVHYYEDIENEKNT